MESWVLACGPQNLSLGEDNGMVVLGNQNEYNRWVLNFARKKVFISQ
ncbi:hypothetical protein D1BOALGB6SA_8316 [Olavius sp. associated proteobacterium Delta 1]|nr:hypothetical protein D1BOALGB6SA_8316 [Olavius sp. associated proteobacterium Delta 1]